MIPEIVRGQKNLIKTFFEEFFWIFRELPNFHSRLVYAFEPIGNTFEFLRKNVERNKVHNVILLNYGLSKIEEEKKLYYFKGGSAIASFENLISHENVQKISCQMKTLDHVIKELNINSVEFIKCDIEGAEFFMLQGSKKTLMQFNPLILMEVYEEWCNKCGYSSNDIMLFLKSIGYEIFQTMNGRLYQSELTNFLNQERYNYFFLHKIKHRKLIVKYNES